MGVIKAATTNVEGCWGTALSLQEKGHGGGGAMISSEQDWRGLRTEISEIRINTSVYEASGRAMQEVIRRVSVQNKPGETRAAVTSSPATLTGSNGATMDGWMNGWREGSPSNLALKVRYHEACLEFYLQFLAKMLHRRGVSLNCSRLTRSILIKAPLLHRYNCSHSNTGA